jgi:hypothetical protein
MSPKPHPHHKPQTHGILDTFQDATEKEKSSVRWPVERTKITVLNKEDAAKLYNGLQFPQQRRIKNRTVAEYVEDLNKDAFRDSVITIGKTPTGAQWILDGNHTLLSIIESGISLLVRIEVRSVRDENDAGALYDTFDASPRTMSDIITFYGLTEETKVSSSRLNRFSSGILLIERNFPEKLPKTFQKLERVHAISRWKGTCPLANKALEGAGNNATTILRRTAAVAMMMFTFKYSPEKAMPFWKAIANVSFKSGDPTRATYTYLTSADKPHPGEQFLALSLCWNAYFRGQELSTPHVYGGKNTVTILGTPWADHKIDYTVPKKK